jgi:hypothetical protein
MSNVFCTTTEDQDEESVSPFGCFILDKRPPIDLSSCYIAVKLRMNDFKRTEKEINLLN